MSEVKIGYNASSKCVLANSVMMTAMRSGEAATTQALCGHAQLGLGTGVRWFSGAASLRAFGSLSELSHRLDVEGILDRRAI